MFNVLKKGESGYLVRGYTARVGRVTIYSEQFPHKAEDELFNIFMFAVLYNLIGWKVVIKIF